jgi:hypothetical protein
MTTLLEEQLNQIITLSQQILDGLGNELELIKDNTQEIEESSLVELNNERDKLIKLTFKESHSEHYPDHIPLINKIMELDGSLITQAEKNKLALKTSLLNMKKNQKASNTYKKY